jgi:phospholipid-transporting ATPase
MFIHGREAYRRNAYLVKYTIYKNVFFVLPQYWFGIYSGFTGQMVYEQWLYQLYNLCVASFPPMWFALFDFEYEKERFLKDPSLFSIGLQNACFGTRIFWQWFFYGAVQAFIVLNLCFFSTEYVRNDGETVGLWVSGTLAYAAVVIAVNQKVLMATHNIDLIQVILVLGSILLFFFAVFVESNVMFFKDLIGVFKQMMVDSNTWFMILLVVGLFYVTEKLIQHADEELSRRKKASKTERAHSDGDIEDLLNLKTPIKKVDQVFHGYAFS